MSDAFDAIVSDRPYRRGMPVDRAISVLQRGAGTQRDPELVPTFIDGMRNDSGPPQPEDLVTPLA